MRSRLSTPQTAQVTLTVLYLSLNSLSLLFITFRKEKKEKARCVCETRMPLKHSSFEKDDPDI